MFEESFEDNDMCRVQFIFPGNLQRYLQEAIDAVFGELFVVVIPEDVDPTNYDRIIAHCDVERQDVSSILEILTKEGCHVTGVNFFRSD